ncbi:MAG: S1 RNA-binding domain-containing protein [Oscillospiraceae bacterium]|jgi:S1 RNA binding domain protein|nr:S1 RNA-binding domain-containing protein [Oscillospiraceae bacterium]
MQLEVGKIYDGKVKGIAQYGAFIEIDGAGTGMVHISEIANSFVKDVNDYLKEGQEVKVKVLNINDDGKIALSIKKANENAEEQLRPAKRPERRPNVWEPKKKPPVTELGFEDMLTRFKQNSEEKICALKRNTERKTGSRRGK